MCKRNFRSAGMLLSCLEEGIVELVGSLLVGCLAMGKCLVGCLGLRLRQVGVGFGIELSDEEDIVQEATG